MIDLSRTARLPLRPNPILGRKGELQTIYRMLAEDRCRLLTLVGPGGVGKTRLAIAAGERMLADRLATVGFVDLTRIDDPMALPSLITATLGINVGGTVPLRALESYLSSTSDTVLILDNFEHVLEAGLTVAGLLESCPDVRILVTSREPLRLSWEQRLVVLPLRVPDLTTTDLHDVGLAPSVDLFLKRAHAVNLDFGRSDDELRRVSEVCVRLDGVPLAIELAAARANVLTASEIASRLTVDTRSLLRNVVRDAPERHHSIQSMLDWSFRLLSAYEQLVFSRLGVFAGEFTLEAAMHVLAGSNVEDPVARLSSLCDKGLLSVTASGPHSRYRLHETVRAYAVDRLEASGNSHLTRSLHASYYLELAERANASFRHLSYAYTPLSPVASDGEQPGSRVWADALALDYGNLRMAMAWYAETRNYDLALHLAATLQWFWWISGRLDEGLRVLERAVGQAPDSEPAALVDALCGLGVLYRQCGRPQEAGKSMDRAVSLARTAKADEMLARSLCELATAQFMSTNFDQAERSLREALEIWSRLSDEWGCSVTRGLLGSLAFSAGRPEDALRACKASAGELMDIGDRRTAWILLYLAAGSAAEMGRLSEAIRILYEILPDVAALGEASFLGGLFELASLLISLGGSPEAGARCLGSGISLRVGGFSRQHPEKLVYERAMRTLRASLTPAVMTANLEAGKRETSIEVLSEVEDSLRTLMAKGPTLDGGGTNPLSAREREVLELVAAGWSNSEIADRLNLTQSAVKFHVSAIFTHLGVRRRTEAVIVAVRKGYVSLDQDLPAPPD